jgi:NitT/TauT family transport system permease protein
MKATSGEVRESHVTEGFLEDVGAKYKQIYLKRREQVKIDRVITVIEGAIGITAFVVMWYTLSHTIMTNVPDPIMAAKAAIPLITDLRFYKGAANSFYQVIVGFLVACAIGIPLGLIMGWRRTLYDVFGPIVEILRPVPPVAWIPLAIIIFIKLEFSTPFIVFIGAFFPVVINSWLGAQSIDLSLYRAILCLGASPRQVFRHVVFPGALPYILAGMQIGMGVAWVCVVAAEMMGGKFGLGYLTWESYNLIRYPEIIICMASLGSMGYACSAAIRALSNKYLAWKKVYTAR